jgi:hypothetical protein
VRGVRVNHEVCLVEVAVVGCTLDHVVAVRKLLSNVVRSACSNLCHTEGGNLGQIPLVVIWQRIASFFAVVRVIVLLTNGCSHHGVLGYT